VTLMQPVSKLQCISSGHIDMTLRGVLNDEGNVTGGA